MRVRPGLCSALAVAGLAAAACRSEDPSALSPVRQGPSGPVKPTGMLALRVEADATVGLELADGDDLRAGRAPWVACGLETGKRTIRVSAPGYRDAEVTCEVRDRELTVVDIGLQPVGALDIAGAGDVRVSGPDGAVLRTRLPWSSD